MQWLYCILKVMFCFTFQILICSLSCASSIMFHVQYIGDIQCLKHHRTLVCDVHCHRSGSFRQRSLKRAQLRACTMYVYMYTCIYTCIYVCIHVYMIPQYLAIAIRTNCHQEDRNASLWLWLWLWLCFVTSGE